jgi:hypothetical protein
LPVSRGWSKEVKPNELSGLQAGEPPGKFGDRFACSSDVWQHKLMKGEQNGEEILEEVEEAGSDQAAFDSDPPEKQFRTKEVRPSFSVKRARQSPRHAGQGFSENARGCNRKGCSLFFFG